MSSSGVAYGMTREPMYIVLEFDEPVYTRVIQLRRTCGDDFRASLPAEITLTGSGGVGPLKPDQSIGTIRTQLEALAAANPPIYGEFDAMLRFPNTNLFVLTVKDEVPFRAMHQRLAACGLQFQPNAFPFKPHCTISSNPVSEEEAEARLRMTLPDKFTLSNLALYGLEDGRVTRMVAVPLRS